MNNHRTQPNYSKISNQIQCVMREIRMREIVYPKRVATGKMEQTIADYELNCMKAVYETLCAAERAHLDKPWNQSAE